MAKCARGIAAELATLHCLDLITAAAAAAAVAGSVLFFASYSSRLYLSRRPITYRARLSPLLEMLECEIKATERSAYKSRLKLL